MPPFYGATYEKMAGLGYVQWPCPSEDHPGTPYLYTDSQFATEDGKGVLSCAPWQPPHEQTDRDYPLALCTVREVGHYSCRSMTGNCATLKILADEPGYVQINPDDASQLGVIDQALIWIASRRGKVIARASVTERANRGAVYMTYQWWIGACNELTVDHVDPVSKTPEFKHCAVKVEAIGDQSAAEQYVEQQYHQLKKRLLDAAMVQ